MNDNYPRFHLAVAVTDLEAARAFYGELLGCSTGRSSQKWIDFDFWGHQLVTHLVAVDEMPAVATNPVDGEYVPASHFGPIVAWDEFELLVQRLQAAAVEFVIKPGTRFAGKRGEQKTLFVKDPSGNHLEFKCFRNIELLFATEGLDYP